MQDSILQNKSYGHPCFDAKSHGSVGRIHLPVAPRCNIKCNYCSRKYACANENRPGVTTKVISPAAALERVREAIRLEPRIRVVGIAGPGDPLANKATFTTMALVKQEFPHLTLCLSTNGLLLPDKLDELLDSGLDFLTVTINAVNDDTAARIYQYVCYDDVVLQGGAAAARLRENQFAGISRAIQHGIKVKVNSVLLPGINEDEMVPLSRALHEMGVETMNIMPLLPQARFSHLVPVSPSRHNDIREACSAFMPQIYHCRQCRADAVGLLGHDMVLSGCA